MSQHSETHLSRRPPLSKGHLIGHAKQTTRPPLSKGHLVTALHPMAFYRETRQTTSPSMSCSYSKPDLPAPAIAGAPYEVRSICTLKMEGFPHRIWLNPFHTHICSYKAMHTMRMECTLMIELAIIIACTHFTCFLACQKTCYRHLTE